MNRALIALAMISTLGLPGCFATFEDQVLQDAVPIVKPIDGWVQALDPRIISTCARLASAEGWWKRMVAADRLHWFISPALAREIASDEKTVALICSHPPKNVVNVLDELDAILARLQNTSVGHAAR